ncbi:MAG: phage virion morphogenesis protein [Bosea sp.]|uniref:phage virion morphogenesis protein n=1 Tax=Bosea sp. (in: a-proteobacteria) TaxID=1871050 RepID=UPI001AD3904F|nr:phage virion morphogenesis protein [Bosea sp. (in: a-proteobacteria)]MBN9471670.1 phage virion morphogenesis protein [Bosea sp. (in: a-proteobacteria)]
MAGVSITVDDAAVISALDRIIQAGGEPPMDKIGSHLLFSTQRRFEAQAGPGGVPWQRHARSTLAKMPAARRAAPQLLRNRGRLYDSMVYEATADTVEVGTNVKTARAHQLGVDIERPARTQTIYRKFNAKTGKFDPKFIKRKRKQAVATEVAVGAHVIRIPARPFLGFDDDDRREVLAIVDDALREIPGVEGVSP